MSGTWQDRLVKERVELVERLQKLETFRNTDKHELLSAEDIGLLAAQQVVMQKYLIILVKRITRL